MRICHLTSAHKSNDIRIFQKECVSLAEAGHEVYLVATGESREEKKVKVIGVGTNGSSRLKRMIYTTKNIYKKAKSINADIYHIHDPELLPYAVKLKKYNKIVVFDSHENTLEYMDEKKYIPALLRKPFAKAYKFYATYIFKKIDALISVTPFICEQLRKINPNTVMITNYPFLEVCSSSVTNLEDSHKICFTGGISEQWCIHRIEEAIADIENVKFVLCGVLDSDYAKVLQRTEGWNKCEYVGIVSHNEADSIQKGSIAGMAILQYSKNTFGNVGTIGNTKLFEYMANGIPVICTDFVLWKEIIEKYQCGLCVNPYDTEAIEYAINYICQNRENAMQMGKNGRMAVEKEYNWETQKRVLVDFYKRFELER